MSHEWSVTPQSIEQFHKQVNRVLTPRAEQQLSLALPRFHFGNAYEAALHAVAIEQQQQRERLNQEQRIDRLQIEADEAAENEAYVRDLQHRLGVIVIDENGGAL